MHTPEYRLDEYTRQLQIQNAGGTCEHCGSAVGHFNVCPLVNDGKTPVRPPTVEAFYRPERKQEAEPDVQWLEALASLPDPRS